MNELTAWIIKPRCANWRLYRNSILWANILEAVYTKNCEITNTSKKQRQKTPKSHCQNQQSILFSRTTAEPNICRVESRITTLFIVSSFLPKQNYKEIKNTERERVLWAMLTLSHLVRMHCELLSKMETACISNGWESACKYKYFTGRK